MQLVIVASRILGDYREANNCSENDEATPECPDNEGANVRVDRKAVFHFSLFEKKDGFNFSIRK